MRPFSYADLIRLSEMLDELPPRPAKLECTQPVLDYLRERVPAGRERLPWEPGLSPAITGIPIVLDESMEPDTWRVVDRDGVVLHEGRVR